MFDSLLANPSTRRSEIQALAASISQPGLNNSSKPRLLERIKAVDEDDFYPKTPFCFIPTEISLCSFRVIHPESTFKMVWDLMIFVIMLYQAIYVPFVLCFAVIEDSGMMFLEFTVTLIFMLDILLNFNTGMFLKGNLIDDRKLIAKDYLKFWFWLDLVSSFPYDWVLTGNPFEPAEIEGSKISKVPRLIRLFKLVRFFRLFRLLKLAKIKKVMMKIEEYVPNNYIVMIFLLLKLLCVVFFIAHLAACFWYYISLQESLEQSDTWVSQFEIRSSRSLTAFDYYIAALYWAFATMSTVGYGDFVAHTTNERIYATLSMVLACGMFAYTVGSIGSIVSKSSADENSHRESVVSVNSYMKNFNLPSDLQFRVRRYLEYRWEHDKSNTMDEEAILQLLSEPLREEIYANIHGKLVRRCKLFDGFGPNFIMQFTKLLKTEIFAPGDSIFDEKERSYKIFFVVSGLVDIYHKKSNSSFIELRKNSYFGEISFFTGHPRTASARCLVFTDLLAVERAEITSLLQKSPEAERFVETIKLRCADLDFTALEVNCFLCGRLGHVALMCKTAILNYDNEDVKKKWIEWRSKAASVKVTRSTQPKFVRKAKRPRGEHYNVIHTFGVERQANQMYAENTTLRRKVRKFTKGLRKKISTEASSDVSPSIYDIDESRMHEVEQANFDVIYSSHESSSSESNSPRSRSLSFDYSLTGRNVTADFDTPDRRIRTNESSIENSRAMLLEDEPFHDYNYDREPLQEDSCLGPSSEPFDLRFKQSSFEEPFEEPFDEPLFQRVNEE